MEKEDAEHRATPPQRSRPIMTIPVDLEYMDSVRDLFMVKCVRSDGRWHIEVDIGVWGSASAEFQAGHSFLRFLSPM
jgi:hypothetical protein